MSYVIHVDRLVHAEAKAYCTRKGWQLKDWVSMLIREELQRREPKSLERMPEPKPETDILSQPPFWEKS